MVGFTAYTVAMRYIFLDPPFWGDTLTMFANIGLVMLAFVVATRDDDHIAMQGFYAFISPVTAAVLDLIWNVVILAFGLFLAWYGYQAALDVPGQFWELGGLPKRYPMMVMPFAGLLTAIAAAFVVIRDILSLAHRGSG
jgi:TRAP-type C4-dicarboxylate transport system permease small subunit